MITELDFWVETISEEFRLGYDLIHLELEALTYYAEMMNFELLNISCHGFSNVANKTIE